MYIMVSTCMLPLTTYRDFSVYACINHTLYFHVNFALHVMVKKTLTLYIRNK